VITYSVVSTDLMLDRFGVDRDGVLRYATGVARELVDTHVDRMGQDEALDYLSSWSNGYLRTAQNSTGVLYEVDGLEPVIAHGTHNQKDHGRRLPKTGGDGAFSGFTRPQLRDAANRRGIALEPRESRESIERKLAKHLAGDDEGKGGDKPEAESPVEVAKTRVLDAYAKLPKGPAGYVGLADLRDQLSDLERADVDEALRQLSRLPGVHVSPVANRKSLTQRDRDAAVRIGEDENMMISVEEPRKASPEPGADVAPTETPTRMTSAQYTQLLKDENLRLSLLRGMSEKDAKAQTGPDASIDDLKKSNASLRARLRSKGIDYRTEEQRNTDDAEKNRLLDEVERLAVASGHDGPAKRAGASKMSRRELASFVADAQEFQERRDAKQNAESRGSAAVAAFKAAEDKSRASKRQVGYIKGLLRQRASSGGDPVDGPTSTEDIQKLSNAEARAYINRLLRGDY
jgi:hypothetical protein